MMIFFHRVFLLPLCLALFVSSPISADECRKIVAAGHPDWQPVSFLDEKQKTMIGVSYELLEDYARQLSLPIEIRPKTPWKRVMRELEKGDIDIVTEAFFSDERASFADFSDSYMEFSLVAVVGKNRDFTIKSLDDLIPLSGVATLGDYYGAAFENYAKEKKLNINRGSMLDLSTFEMLVLNRVDYTILSDVNFLLKSARHGY